MKTRNYSRRKLIYKKNDVSLFLFLNFTTLSCIIHTRIVFVVRLVHILIVNIYIYIQNYLKIKISLKDILSNQITATDFGEKTMQIARQSGKT